MRWTEGSEGYFAITMRALAYSFVYDVACCNLLLSLLTLTQNHEEGSESRERMR